MTGTSIYYIWGHLNERCANPNAERYKSYGGRGIRVCDQWTSFENFYADMSPSWFEGASLERIDVNGNYEKDNCTWIPIADQSKNKQNSRIIETPWGSLNAAYVGEKLGISRGQFYWRLNNWPQERWLEPAKIR
jgi:hypothetical protein